MDIFTVIRSLNDERKAAKNELDALIRKGELEGRTKMTADEAKRSTDLFAQIERINGKIELAKKVRDEDAEADRLASITYPTNAERSHVEREMPVGGRVSRNGVEL